MIKLKDILLETSILSEAGEIKVQLSPAQIKSLDAIFSQAGSDLNQVLKSNVTEKSVPEYTKMSSKELEEKAPVIAIKQNVVDGIEKLLDLGSVAKDWYSEMNTKILDAFGDSDGTLFLILLAIFSPRNPLAQNFKLAAQTYQGIKKDLSDATSKKRLEEMMELKATDLYKKMKSEDAYKDLATVRGIIKGNMGVNTYLPNILNLLRMYKRNNYTLSKQQAVDEISKHFTPSGAVDKDSIISASKVFSFTLNLLDPNFKFESGWIPVTMDTWMASFFYPEMNKKQKSALLAKDASYAYIAKKTQEIAGQYGMTPTQFQAAIWVGMIKKAKGENYDSTFLTAIDKNLAKLNVKIDELKGLNNFFAKAAEVVGNAGI